MQVYTMCIQAKAAAGGGAKKKGLSVQKPAAFKAATAAEPRKSAAAAALAKVAAKGMGKKAAKPAADEGAPKVKRAKSAYIFFCSDRRGSVKGADAVYHISLLTPHMLSYSAQSSIIA